MSAAESSSSGKEPASVPRFQRRQSERAYYEGAFKPDGGMDYSSEHAAESSPWSTSPKHARGFGAQGNAPGSGQSPFGPAGQEGGGYQDRPSTSNSTTFAASQNGRSQYGQSAYHPQDEPYAQQQSYNNGDQGLPPPALGDQRRPEAQRYHSRPQQPRPQYKLQCKVTGLERTGKKDPILRFDAHVQSR